MTPRDQRVERDVYRPAEDSTLLIDAAREALEPGSLVVDTGTGSGVVGDRLQQTKDIEVIASDINPHACRDAADRGLDTVRGSLLTFIGDGSVDAAVFNPPYLPADEGLPDDWLDRASTGGPSGHELLVEWIGDLKRVLRDSGVGICIVSSHSDIDQVTSTAIDEGFTVSELASRSFPFERLVALELAAP